MRGDKINIVKENERKPKLCGWEQGYFEPCLENPNYEPLQFE